MKIHGWQTASLQNNWQNYGQNFQTAGYRKIGKQIYLKGLIRHGNSNSIAFTLPNEYKPVNEIKFATNSNNEGGIAVVTIDTNGNVTVNSFSGWVSLAQINFFVD